MTAALLSDTHHRPWPLPRMTWIMTQSWKTLLFAHWPVPPEALQPLIPKPLTLETYDGQAWIGIVPFDMGYRLRGMPWTVRFRELNVRTYVRYEDKPGVFFFSLDANARLTVHAARLTYTLPYYMAEMSLNTVEDAIRYQCRRTHAQARSARFSAVYRPVSPPFHAAAGTLDHWLTERYCLYAVNHAGHLCRSEVHHQPWPLHAANAELMENTMSPVPLPTTPPLLHYSPGVDVLVWPLLPVANAKQAR